MNFKHNRKLTHISKALRKNMTPEERILWYDFLKKLPITIKRQETIENFIVDFYCARNKTVIEIDGSQHYESDGIARDEQRDETLRSFGINFCDFQIMISTAISMGFAKSYYVISV